MEERWLKFFDECVLRLRRLKRQMIAEGIARGISRQDAAAAFEGAETVTPEYLRYILQRRKGAA